jgi:guanylate kinase
VSHTTRAPRAGEKDGVDYYFVKEEVMRAGLERGEFLEHAQVHRSHYGTSKKAVASVSEAHQVCILDIDIQGVRQVRACQARGEFDAALYVFVAPPNMAELEKRLRGRGTEDDAKIAVRLANAREEMRDADAIPWGLYIVNEDLAASADQLARAMRPALDDCARQRALDARPVATHKAH